MSYKNLDDLSHKVLSEIAREMDLPLKRSKKDLLFLIKKAFREYERYKKKTIDKYKRKHLLGKGKEGVTYSVSDKHGREYAMKTFKKTKSADRIIREAELQKLASEEGISPRIIDVDTVSNYIVMDIMDEHLIEKIRKQKGEITQKQQREIINIYKKLDKAGVFHSDPNLQNYMLKNNKVYIIDFGMAKKITQSLKSKYGTNSPNMELMTLGFVLKLKNNGFPKSSYSYMIKFLSEDQKTMFNLR